MGIRVGMGEGTTRRTDPSAAYDPDGFWDEAFAGRGEPRPHYAQLLRALGDDDLAARRDAVLGGAAARGAAFGGAGGMTPFLVDPVPRLLTAEEWAVVERGITQRVLALNAFIADVYGPRAIIADGVVPERVVVEADHFEPALAGVEPHHAGWATVAGLDLVRGADGRFAVLEDNLRTPSGLAYALVARETVGPGLPGEPRDVAGPAAALLAEALRAAAPEGVDEPLIVLLTDGEDNSAHWEHVTLGRLLGIPLVALSDLEHCAGALRARLPGGPRRVDVVYRRTDEDRLTDERGALTAVGEALLEPWRAGRVGVANAFGTGVADDKLAHAYVEAAIRFYLGEEPVLPSVPTYDLSEPAARERALERLDELVVKPRSGYGGEGVLIGPLAGDDELRRARDAVIATPASFIAQETVALSRHPTVVGDALEPRHVDLRPFAFSGARAAVLPGGLTRVAFGAGAMVVNSSRNGGGKDTWVMG
jgi:uncharacterized circularly permuted ATP-grasp superfamily protein